MASYNELNALIDAYINRNGVQAITGQILNGVLKAMVEQLGRGYTIMGAAIPTTDPGTPDGPECYFASETGTYTDFDGLQVVPGELALLCYTPSDGWTKETIYEGFQEVQATIDGNVGTPSVGVSYANGVLSFDFHNMKGNPGDPAGFGTIGADITGGVGTPGVSVESSGPATAKNLQFHFTNLKGETGVTSVLATVDNTSGNPQCAVSLVGQQLTLAFSGLKGAQGDTGSSVDYPFTIVNNLTTDDATQALSAAQGVVLQGEITQLEHKVDGNEFAKFNEGKLSAKLIDNSYVDKNDGSFDPYNGWKRTDYINVVPFSQLVITLPNGTTYNAYYDKDKAFIRALYLSAGENTITIPDNACYMALSANDATMAALDIAIGEYRLQTLKSAVDSLGTQVTGLDADKTEISANIDFVSDNKAVNGFFKELYLIGVNYQNVAFVNVQGSASVLVCTFKDSSNNTLASLQSDGPLSDTFISRDSSGAIMLASVDWGGFDAVKVQVNICTLTEKVGSLASNPAIVGFLSRKVTSNTIPTFTKSSGYRINASGEVVSAGAAWFYTSPISVKGGDCVLLRTGGNVAAAPICLTDEQAAFYVPIVAFSGNDPDTYFYRAKENGFVAITGYNNAYFRLTVFRDSDIAAIYDKFKKDEDAVIEEMKAVPVDFRKRDSSVYVGADIDADWESVAGATKTNSVQYNNITRRRVRCATLVGPSNNSIARIRFAKSVNANLHPFLFSICIGNYSDIVNAPAGDVRLIFYSGSQPFASSRSMKIALQTATATEEYNTVFNRNGWFCICAFLPSYEGSGVDVGESFDPTDVTGFGVHLLNSRSLPVTVHIERMDFLNDVMTKPGIVTVIDNFNTQVPAMADYAYSKGVRLNLSIIPGYYEGAPGAPTCASKEEIARLAAQGHFIWNHTWSHPNFNDLTIPQIHDQINLAERWMQKNGYGEGKRFVSIPSARFNTRSCNAALDTNVEMFFHSWVREKKQVFIQFAPVSRVLPITWLDSDALNAGMSGADIATVALKCLTYKGITVIGFHGTYITNEGGGMANWEAYIDAIAESNAYHYGLDEIRDGQWV